MSVSQSSSSRRESLQVNETSSFSKYQSRREVSLQNDFSFENRSSRRDSYYASKEDLYDRKESHAIDLNSNRRKSSTVYDRSVHNDSYDG